jgi:hypothetical protein
MSASEHPSDLGIWRVAAATTIGMAWGSLNVHLTPGGDFMRLGCFATPGVAMIEGFISGLLLKFLTIEFVVGRHRLAIYTGAGFYLGLLVGLMITGHANLLPLVMGSVAAISLLYYMATVFGQYANW